MKVLEEMVEDLKNLEVWWKSLPWYKRVWYFLWALIFGRE
jgi:hypothetical protein